MSPPFLCSICDNLSFEYCFYFSSCFQGLCDQIGSTWIISPISMIHDINHIYKVHFVLWAFVGSFHMKQLFLHHLAYLTRTHTLGCSLNVNFFEKEFPDFPKTNWAHHIMLIFPCDACLHYSCMVTFVVAYYLLSPKECRCLQAGMSHRVFGAWHK